MIVTLLRGPQFRAFLMALILAVCGYSFKLRFGPIDLGILLRRSWPLSSPRCCALAIRHAGHSLAVGCLGLAYTAGGPLFTGAVVRHNHHRPHVCGPAVFGLYLMTAGRTLAEQLRLLSGLTSTYQVVAMVGSRCPRTARHGQALPDYRQPRTRGDPCERFTRNAHGGPSVIRTRRFETIKRIYDLRPGIAFLSSTVCARPSRCSSPSESR
jgi:hypothetical protein